MYFTGHLLIYNPENNLLMDISVKELNFKGISLLSNSRIQIKKTIFYIVGVL